jgi:putative FmdB family regulatory protein
MPLYEYECAKGHRFEVIQKFSDPLVEKCPTCGSPVRKLLSSPAFQFKGSGWYVTDYARKDSAGGSKPTSDHAPSSESESKKSETNPPAATNTGTTAATPPKKD